MRITSMKETETKLYLVTIFPKVQPFSYEVELFVTTEKNSSNDVEKMIYEHLEDLTNKNNQLVIEDKGDVNFIFKRIDGKQTRLGIVMIDKTEIGGIDIKYLRTAESSLMETYYHISRASEMTDEKAEQNA